MRSVSVIGVGMSRFGERWDASFRQLVAEAGIAALKDAKIDGKGIQAIFGGCMASGRFLGQEHIGALIVDQLGLNPIASTRLEAACASGSVAFRSGIMAVASGMYDMVAVGGAEKMTEVSVEDAATALGGAGDQEWELFQGATFPALYALMARRHMKEYGTTEEQMALCAVKNHENGSKNPYAQYQNKITLETAMNSPIISSPLKLFDCSPISDGAAVAILCETSKAKKICEKPIEIIASAQASDTLALAERKSLTELNATKVAAKQAFEQAKLKPKDIQTAEVHDCFTIAEIMAIEDLGFFGKGQAGKAIEAGETKLNSAISINSSGGLKACGHPVGATGVKQVVEAVWQLRGEAEERQVKNVEYALTHNVGGSGATATVHIFKRA
ncbi:MAG TPA: thiolase domain-containing protein [Candidatus Norongarragalinales archaeon]|nr:thiolase domain-containing protein [Candidatus Norongarragalinales archaeon]